MVSPITRDALVVLLALGFLATAFLNVGEAQQRAGLYAAEAYDIDFAVVDGITKTEKNFPEILEGVRTVIVPHHLVASEATALGVRALKSFHPSIVIVLSPDHFHRCPTLLCTTQGTFETFFGSVPVNREVVDRLVRYEGLVSVSELFAHEHGVTSIMPFINHYLPDASVVPIVVSQQGIEGEEILKNLRAAFEWLLSDTDTALVVSTDFSHYVPLRESNALDDATERVFCSGDENALRALNNPAQSDCPLCLSIASAVAKKYDFWNPIQLWHSNSADILGDVSAKETTSHFVFALPMTKNQGLCTEIYQ